MKRKNKRTDLKIGICIKNMDRVVLSQNSFCQKFCGNRLGQSCNGRCMLHSSEKKTDSNMPEVTQFGYALIKNLNKFDDTSAITEKSKCDAVVLHDGETLTTVLFPKNQFVEKIMEILLTFRFTESEKKIIKLVLLGKTNKKVALELYISAHTLKTHLNNINKKLPDSVNIQQLRRQCQLRTGG